MKTSTRLEKRQCSEITGTCDREQVKKISTLKTSVGVVGVGETGV